MAVLSLFAASVISPEASRSAQQKLDRIAGQKLTPGGSVALTEHEINAYLRYDYASELPAGVSEPFIQLEPDRVIGNAQVDFLEWQAAKGSSPGFLLRWLLQGKRRVDVTCHYTSRDGHGQVDVESVKIGGVPISASAVTFLIENVVQPRYPAAVVGKPVPLGYNLKQVRVERDRAMLTAR